MRRRRGFGAVVLLLALGAAAYYAWRHETARPLRPANAAPLPLVIAPGASVRDVAAQLYGLGLVRHPAIFQALVTIRGDQGATDAADIRFRE